MCGIVGYIGKNKNPGLGLELLKKLEYRGYDSAGLVVLDSQSQEGKCLKAVGRISNLEQKFINSGLTGTPALYHTRWATHGRVTEKNAHPHHGCRENIFLVHNGIIENYKELKKQLIKEGHSFYSDTDTEVLAHLIEKFFNGSLEQAVMKALRLVEGAYGLAVIAQEDPDKIVVARNSSPVLIGIGEGENLVASDASALVSRTKRVVYLDDGEIALLFPDKVVTMDASLNKKKKLIQEIEWEIEDAQKSGFPHFMLKEIFEEPDAVRNVMRGRFDLEDGDARLGGLEEVAKELESVERLILSACGTSYYACLVGEYMLEELAGIPVEVEYAPEFRYRSMPLDSKTAFIAVSQSGETADTLAAVKKANEAGMLTLGVVNVVGSSIARETRAGVYLRAGPEIGVASTKAFVSQLTAICFVALFLARKRGLSKEKGREIIKGLNAVPEKIEKILDQEDKIKALSRKYKNYNNFLFIGRKYNFPVALEGALKLKEISYIHAEGYGAAEMKHGPIALIDDEFPVVALCLQDSVYEKMISNVEEVKARNGKVIAVATQGDEKIKELADDVVYLPFCPEIISPILSVVPLHLFAYYVSTGRGLDPDHPRSLAKAVTVE